METSRNESILAVYDAHVETIYRYVYRRCRDHSLAEDITQETFMTAVRYAEDSSKLNIAWLQTVARNRLFDVLRRDVRSEEKLRLIANSTTSSSEVNPVERMRVQEGLEALPIHYRLVLTLHYLNGVPVADIAEQLERTAKSVEGLLARARRALATELEPASSYSGEGGNS